MKGTKPPRIESPLNSELASLIPVLYGALFSYALYVFAQLLVDLARRYGPENLGRPHGSEPVGLGFSEFLPLLILFTCFSLFLGEDLGEIIKLGKAFPFLRTSRYSHELIVCFWFLASFAFLSAKSSLAIIAFGIAVLWGGVWCNQLKEEYDGHASRISCFAETQRDLQYAGGAAFVLEGSSFLIKYNSTTLNIHMALCFAATFAVWLLLYGLFPSHRNGPGANEFAVNMALPDRWLLQDSQNLLK